MAGEGVVRWDYTQAPGESHVYIPDYLADTNADKGDEPNRDGLVALNDVGSPEEVTADGGDGGTAVA